MTPPEQVRKEQEICLKYANENLSVGDIASKTGLSRHQVRRRLSGARKADRLDPSILAQLAQRGVTDLAGLHSGWLLEKNNSGSGQSLYFYLGPDQEKVSFADAMRDVLSEIPKLNEIHRPVRNHAGEGYASWLFLADLHMGGEYGCDRPQEEFKTAIDDLVLRMPPAEHAVLCELGDLLDANDHKGVTPASGNPTDTRRDQHLTNTKNAIRLLKYAAYRLLETHQTVEMHLIRGNHDESAYIAVLLALAEHFSDNPRIEILVPKNEYQEEFRVVSWGKCAFFPHHGDKAKPDTLKDVWADQFAQEWATATAYRLIPTAHFHHLKSADLIGAEWRQFRTIHRPNRWARMQGMFSRGALCALTVHRDRGPEYETISNIKPSKEGKPQ